jgi:hypothetical protein
MAKTALLLGIVIALLTLWVPPAAALPKCPRCPKGEACRCMHTGKVKDCSCMPRGPISSAKRTDGQLKPMRPPRPMSPGFTPVVPNKR